MSPIGKDILTQKISDFLHSTSEDDDHKKAEEILCFICETIRSNASDPIISEKFTDIGKAQEIADKVDFIILVLKRLPDVDSATTYYQAKEILKSIPNVMEDVISLYDPESNNGGVIPQFANEIIHFYIKAFGVEKPPLSLT